MTMTPSSAPLPVPFKRPPKPQPLLSPTNAATPLSATYGAMITEIVARLEPLSAILKRYQVTKQQFTALRATKAFTDAIYEQRKAFSSLHNTSERVRLKAQLLTERLLEDMYEVASTHTMPPSARVSAFAQIKNLTGLEKPENAQPQQKFSLTINLTGGKQVHVESASHSENSFADPASPLPNGNPYAASEMDLDFEPLDDAIDEPSEELLLPTPPKPWKQRWNH